MIIGTFHRQQNFINVDIISSYYFMATFRQLYGHPQANHWHKNEYVLKFHTIMCHWDWDFIRTNFCNTHCLNFFLFFFCFLNTLLLQLLLLLLLLLLFLLTSSFSSLDGTTVQCGCLPPSRTFPSQLCFWPLFRLLNFAFVNICAKFFLRTIIVS